MKNCTPCKHASWQRREGGNLHPSGDGQCKYPYSVPQLPASMWWIGTVPTPNGGAINRKKELAEHCAYFARENERLTFAALMQGTPGEAQ